MLYILLEFIYNVAKFQSTGTVERMGVPDLVTSLAENPYFSAGFGLFGVGAGAAVLRKGYAVSNDHQEPGYLLSMQRK